MSRKVPHYDKPPGRRGAGEPFLHFIDPTSARVGQRVRDLLPGLTREHAVVRDLRHKPICDACGVQNVHVDPDAHRCVDASACAKRARNWR